MDSPLPRAVRVGGLMRIVELRCVLHLRKSAIYTPPVWLAAAPGG
jgi:hypothetical protein